MSGRPARPLRVLIVEDEMLVAMLVEDMLVELGYEVAGTAARFDEARTTMLSTAFDAAILDVNLDGELSVPLAEGLYARGVPFVFATGYGEHVLGDRFKGVPILRKPFLQAELARALTATLLPSSTA